MTLLLQLITATAACASLVAVVIYRRKARMRRKASPVSVAILASRPAIRRVNRRVIVGCCLTGLGATALEHERLLDAWHDRDRGRVEKAMEECEQSGDWRNAEQIAALRLDRPMSADWRTRLERRRLHAALEASLTVPSPEAPSILSDASDAAQRLKLPSLLPTALTERLRQADRIRDLAQMHVESLSGHASRVADYPPVARRYWHEAWSTAQLYKLPTEAIAEGLANITSPRTLPPAAQLDVLSRRSTGTTFEFDLLIRDRDGKAIRGLTQTDFALRSGTDTITGWRVGEQRDLAAEHSIAVCLDCSNSMQGTPQTLAKQGAWRLLDEVIDDSSVALYAFGTKVNRPLDWTQNRTQAMAALQSLTLQGDTALLHAIYRAVEDLALRPGRRSLIVFTDGRDTVGGVTWEQLSVETKRHGVSLFAVALQTSDLDFVPLQALAESSGGLAFIADDQQLVGRFQAIAESLRVHFYRIVLLNGSTGSESLTIAVGDPPLELSVDLKRMVP